MQIELLQLKKQVTTNIAGWRAGRFEIVGAQRNLLLDGQVTSLSARAFDLLWFLADWSGAVVSKTRLAQALASAVRLASQPLPMDGQWVQLDERVPNTSVADTVAIALGMALSGQQPAADELVEMLGQSQLLLVLDNCEHRLSETADFVDRLCRRA